jgi:hypothetical protein
MVVFYNRKPVEELSNTLGYDDNESDRESDEQALGHDDLYIYNLILLSILPPLSSMITKAFVTLGYIIYVHIGDAEIDQKNIRGVSLPVVFVLMYVVILDLFYSVLYKR